MIWSLDWPKPVDKWTLKTLLCLSEMPVLLRAVEELNMLTATARYSQIGPVVLSNPPESYQRLGDRLVP